MPDKPGDSLRKQYLQFLQAAAKQDGRRVEPKMVDLMCRVMVEKPPGPEEADVMAQITELEAKLGVTTAPGAPQPVVTAPPPPQPPMPPGVHETVLEGPPAEGIPKKATLPAHVVAAFDKAAAMQDSGTGVPAHLDPGDGSAISGTGKPSAAAAAGGVQSSDSCASMMEPPPRRRSPRPSPRRRRRRRRPSRRRRRAARRACRRPARHGGRCGVGGPAQLQGLDAADSAKSRRRTRGAPAALIDARAREVTAAAAPPERPASARPRRPPPSRWYRPPRRRRRRAAAAPPPAAAAAGAPRPTPSLSDAPASSIASAAAAPAAPPPVAEDVGFSEQDGGDEGAAYTSRGWKT